MVKGAGFGSHMGESTAGSVVVKKDGFTKLNSGLLDNFHLLVGKETAMHMHNYGSAQSCPLHTNHSLLRGKAYPDCKHGSIVPYTKRGTEKGDARPLKVPSPQVTLSPTKVNLDDSSNTSSLQQIYCLIISIQGA